MQSAPLHPDGTPRLLVTGGGGYHPLLLARAWTGLWALLSGRTLPAEMPAQGACLLREVGWDLDEDEAYFESLFVSRLDEIQVLPVRPDIERLIEQLQRHPFLQ